MSRPTTVIKERPILYGPAMVRGLLSGIKTQTRRVINPQPGRGQSGFWNWMIEQAIKRGYEVSITPKQGACRYGNPGDQLWVREAHDIIDDPAASEGEAKRIVRGEDGYRIFYVVDYKADGPHGRIMDKLPKGNPNARKWKPSIFMPRWASRITLEITEVRVQRIQSISDADIEAEGIVEYIRSKGLDPERTNHRAAWIDLWDSINAKRVGGVYAWDRNPWTWAVSFKRLEQPCPSS